MRIHPNGKAAPRHSERRDGGSVHRPVAPGCGVARWVRASPLAKPWRSPRCAGVSWAPGRRSNGDDGRAVVAPGRRGGRAVAAGSGAAGGYRQGRVGWRRRAGARHRFADHQRLTAADRVLSCCRSTTSTGSASRPRARCRTVSAYRTGGSWSSALRRRGSTWRRRSSLRLLQPHADRSAQDPQSGFSARSRGPRRRRGSPHPRRG